MKIVMLAVGKLREAHYKTASEDYLNRIRKWLPVEQIEIPAISGSIDQKNALFGQESEALQNRLPADGLSVALDVRGKSLSSEAFSEWLQGAMNRSVPRVSFLIGGAWGLSQKLLDRADLRLSLSAMTLPHELVRVVLLEQIYRALSIWKGVPYHK